MQIIESIAEWRHIRKQLGSEISLGFVPTMGNLHQGHASLLQRSVQENQQTVLSIFVNPTQFNDQQDFTHYPKTLDQDLAIAKAAHVDYILLPNAAEIYPDHYTYKITEQQLSLPLEGTHRPGHFDGVLTVVMKLLCLVKAQRAYFGDKDQQQLQLVKGLTQAFFLDTDIIACATIRETSGLPLSSRNNRLSLEQKKQADNFAQIFHSGLDCDAIKQQLISNGYHIDYLEDYQGRRYVAVRIGDVRLIDNIAI